MIDTEFYAGLVVLRAAGIPELEERTQQLYLERLKGLPDGAFRAGIAELVDGPLCADLIRFRRIPTIHEIREACQLVEARPKGRPYVAGVPLGQLLDAVGPGGLEPTREEAPALVDQVAERAGRRALPAKVLPGPGNTGHRALLQAEGVVQAVPRPAPSAEDWERRRRKLLEQGDELFGAGEFVRERSNG